MKVIFLDVDGELTYSNYKNKETANIDIADRAAIIQKAYNIVKEEMHLHN